MEQQRSKQSSKKKNYYIDKKQLTSRWIEGLKLDPSSNEYIEIRNEVVGASQLIAKALIKMHHFSSFSSEDDLLQEAAIKVLKDYEKFNPEKSNAFNFLTTIIKNHLLTHIFKCRRDYTIFSSIDQENQPPLENEEVFFCPEESSPEFEGEDDSFSFQYDMTAPIIKKERVAIMMAILNQDKIGKDVIAYLGKVNTNWKKDKIKVSEIKSLYTLRNLFAFLKQKGHSSQDIKKYFLSAKEKYLYIDEEEE